MLDFFAGSGTTAQAVLELNAEDGGTRRYIAVQLTGAAPARLGTLDSRAGFRHGRRDRQGPDPPAAAR